MGTAGPHLGPLKNLTGENSLSLWSSWSRENRGPREEKVKRSKGRGSVDSL